MISSDSEKIKQLHYLIDDNFRVAKHCRAIMEFLPEISLHHFFHKLVSKRSQFAVELANKLEEVEGKKPFLTKPAYEKRWPEILPNNKAKNIRKNLKLAKDSLTRYKRALSKINDGSYREILIRHKAIIAEQITELKSLKKLLRDKDQISGHNSDFLQSQKEYI